MLYGHSMLRSTMLAEGVNLQPFVELMVYDDLARMNSDEIQNFLQSESAKVLVEKAVLKKNTMMRLSKADDEKRRVKLCAYQLAKEDKDANWKKMVFHRAKWRQYRDLVMKKYGARAEKIAKMSQKEYIKNAAKEGSTPAK